MAGVQKWSCEGCRDWHWETEILGKPISAVPYLILPNFRQEEISFCTLWTWFLIKTYCSESSLFYHLVNKCLSNRIQRDDPSQVAQKTSDTEAYVVSCQKFLTVHLQETGSSDVFFDVSRWAWEECTFAIQMSPLLHCMQCRSDYLKSKPWEPPNPSFSTPAFCSVCAVLFPDLAALADENLTCIVYDVH